MAKTEVNLQDAAKAEMEALVEQHNQLVQEISDANGRLAEVKQMIIEKQGYMKGLEACEKQCKEK
tara:strand:- start:476 stop:670 length:195 start_codon:yes stop_codon:yes gene_type:complete